MLVLAYKMKPDTLQKLLDIVDYGNGSKMELLAGANHHGYIVYDYKHGYRFLRGTSETLLVSKKDEK